MKYSNKIHVLTIPDLFPKFKGDVQGIFILDYLSATKSYCTNTVLACKLVGEKKGLIIEHDGDSIIQRLSIAEKKPASFLKPFLYIQLFIKGYQTGKKIKNNNIIHAHGSIVSGTLAYLLSKKLNIPFIITEHQGPFSMTSENFWKRNWTRFIMQKASAVLTVSQHLKQEILATKIFPKSIIVTYNPVNTDLFKLKPQGEFKNILFVGRLDNFKGALRCVIAFEKLITLHPDWAFTIVGDGEDYSPIINYISKNHLLQKRVKLKGQQTKLEIANEMQQASFLVFPSKHESFGLVIAEALSSGLPVIVGNKTAPKEFVTDECGLLVPPESIDEISKAMETFINKASNYNSMSLRHKVIENFGFENFGKKLVDIYLSIMNKQ